MKRFFTTGFLLAAAAIGLIAVAVWYIAVGDGDPRKRDAQTLKAHIRSQSRQDSPKRIRSPRKSAKASKSVVPIARTKPDFSADLAESSKLTAEFKKILLDLQMALDLDDSKKVFALIHQLQLRDEWPDGIPKAVKLKALQALSWFGAAGLSEAVGFLADSDPEIREEAMDTFQQQFDDAWDLGDYKLAETMKAMVKIVTDADRLESYYDQFMNMRDIVKADTARAIYESGNKTAIEVLERNLDTIFSADDYEVRTREDVERFQRDAEQAYKDDPSRKQEDDDMYGPMNWNW